MNVGNSVTLIGNLGNDFELKNLGSGRTLAKTSLATNESYKNKEGEYVQNTQWHNLIAWGKKAEIMAKFGKKGSKMAVSGKLEYNTYENDKGVKSYFTQIVVDDFHLLDPKKKQNEEGEDMPF